MSSCTKKLPATYEQVNTFYFDIWNTQPSKPPPFKKTHNSLPNLPSDTTNLIHIHKGDTLYSISKRYEIPINDIIAYNQLTPPFILKTGSTLTLPPKKIHTVEKKDTLYSISRYYNVDMSALANLNKLSEPFVLQVGDKLLIPARVQDIQDIPKSHIPMSQGTQKQNILPLAPQRQKNKFLWPLKGNIILKYGPLQRGMHNDGINISCNEGTPIKASENGVVAYVGEEIKSYGLLILIKHADQWISAYAHLKTAQVERGQTIKRGEIIGYVGKTGNVETPQLHFELRKGKKTLNPIQYLENNS